MISRMTFKRGGIHHNSLIEKAFEIMNQRIIDIKQQFCDHLRMIGTQPLVVDDGVIAFENEFFKWTDLPGGFSKFVDGIGRKLAIATGKERAVLSDLKKGFHSFRHVHPTRDEHIYLIRGELLVRVWDADKETDVLLAPGDIYKIEVNTPHELCVGEDSECVFSWSAHS